VAVLGRDRTAQLDHNIDGFADLASSTTSSVLARQDFTPSHPAQAQLRSRMITGGLDSEIAARMNRPFCFMVPFWGQRYREYFVDRCLPSMLAPGNLPLLRAADGHRVLMATTRPDWEAIINLPVMDTLRTYAIPTLVDIPSPVSDTAPGGADAIRHMNLCLRRLTEAAYGYRAYGCSLLPDVILSDGMVAALIRLAQAGYHLVLCTALRQTEETVLAELVDRGLMPKPADSAPSREALTIPPRVMADLAVRHLHPDVAIFEEDCPAQPFLPPYRFWRVPGRNGIILHGFFAAPILMDYGILEDHHVACFDAGGFEDGYLRDNFYKNGRVHLVQDSDELAMLSLTPASVRQAMPRGRHRKRRSRLAQQWSIRASVGIYARRDRDLLKRDLFRLPIRWHPDDLDHAWHQQERRISAQIQAAVGDYYALADGPDKHRFPPPVDLSPRHLVGDVAAMYVAAAPYLRILAKAVIGDRSARSRIKRRIGGLLGMAASTRPGR
jgi:hypothetical protein